MLKTDRMLARSSGAVAATVAAFTVLAAGCGPPRPLTPPDGGGGTGATPAAQADIAVVFDIDVTSSVADSFRAGARNAVAAAILRVAGQSEGAIDIYVRKIDHNPGGDQAVLGTYHLDAVHDCTGNPFDHRCRRNRERRARDARVITRKIRALRVPVGHAGTNIRGALAIAGEILSTERGEKWLVVASDMRPSNTQPVRLRPVVKLDKVNVVVLFACRQGIALCQERRTAWQAELEQKGAVHPVTFLFSQQMTELWRYH